MTVTRDDTFTRSVRGALLRLYDAPHLRRHPLASLSGSRPLRTVLLEAIDSLSPQSARGTALTPLTARPIAADRAFRLMTLRYVEALPAADVQRRLSLSRASYFRAHQTALDSVAHEVRKRLQGPAGGTSPMVLAPEHTPAPPLPPAQSTIARARSRLPRALSSFVGREEQLTRLAALLDRAPLVTLTGPGGVGKTRLAQRVATQQAERAEVYLVPLAALVEAAQIPAALAESIGLAHDPAVPPLRTVEEFLAPRPALLVLDNFEHLLVSPSAARGSRPQPSVALVAQLLAGCPHLTILVTSRAPLRLAGEQEMALSPLREDQSVTLFEDRARAVRPDQAPADRETIAGICQQVDHLPLAIELAAARLRLFTPQSLHARLAQAPRLAMLGGGPPDAPPRSRTLRDTIAWSYDLLSPPLRAALRALAVFRGGCALSDAEAVLASVLADEAAPVARTGALPEPPEAPRPSAGVTEQPASVLEALEALVSHSLLHVDPPAPPGSEGPAPPGYEAFPADDPEPRFHLLETVREFAVEELDRAGESPRAFGTHAAHFLATVLAANDALSSPRLGRVLRWFTRERDNLIGTLDWLEAHDAVAALQLGVELGTTWWQRTRHYEMIFPRLSRLVETVEREGLPVEPALVARALFAAGRAQTWDYGVAVRYLHRAAGAAEAANDFRTASLAWSQLAERTAYAGERAPARVYARRARAAARQSGDRERRLYLLGLHRVMAWSGLGDTWRDRVQRLWRARLALQRERGDRLERTFTTIIVGLGEYFAGRLAEARALFAEGLACAVEIGSRLHSAQACDNLAMIDIAEGRFESARALLRYALRVKAEEAGAHAWKPTGIPYVIERFAALAAAEGEAVRALRLYGAACAARERLRMRLIEWPEHFERSIAPARAALSPHESAAAEAEGRAMSPDDVISYALA